MKSDIHELTYAWRDNFAVMPQTTIHLLPDHLANQIAAGEVVQRPESVVKELVENSVDAGATHITVIVRDAGKTLIHTIDNGVGLSKADLELATVRHATSKITTQEDLHAIRTLGFRGEALASIAAVADLEIRTRREEEDTGWLLQSTPGALPDVKPCSCDGGTQVYVRNLFYNVPARKKFLKSDLTEFRHISETMQRMALARPDVRFTFYDGSVLVFDLQPTSLQRRSADVLAVDPSRMLLSVDGEESGIRIHGFLGVPTTARQSRSGQFLFLNGRGIVSRPLAHAVNTAHEHLLDQGQHPLFVLHLTIDPHVVDVNVHPQKSEVKFENEHAVYLLVQMSVAAALQKANVIPSFIGNAPLAAQPLQSLQSSAHGTALVVNRFTGEIMPTGSAHSAFGQTPQGSGPGQSGYGQSGYAQSGYGHVQSGMTATERQNLAQLFGKSHSDVAASTVLQLGGHYIVTSSAEGIVVIDQRAAHERILYERLMRRSPDDAVTAQALLFSVTLSLMPSRAALLREHLHEFESLGFRLEVQTNGTVDVHAVPADVRAGSEELVLDEMLQSLEESGRLPADRRRDGVVAIYSARQAMRTADTVQPEEAAAIVRELFTTSVPHTTPRGQPVYIVISYDELSKRFL